MSRARQMRRLAPRAPVGPSVPRYLRLARAHAEWALCGVQRPLAVETLEQGLDRDAAWDRVTDRHRDRMVHHLRGMDRDETRIAIVWLATHPEARARCARRLRREHGEGILPLRISPWGEGWRTAPSATLTAADAE